MVEDFMIKSIQYSTKSVANDSDYSDLYGGGRQGAFEEYNDYRNGNDSDDDDYGAFEREQDVKKAANDLIQKQFSLRKNTQEVSQKTIEKLFSKHSRVQAATSTSTKIKGLTLATREQYLTRISDVLYANYSECQEDQTMDKRDVEDCAIEVEYSIFTSNTTMTMYRNTIAKLISNIKKCTVDKLVYESLLTFKPKPAKHETLGDLFRNISKEQLLKKASSKQALNDRVGKLNNTQSTISDFFAKSRGKTPESAVNLDEDSEDTMGDKSHKDLKSLFGDDDSEEETLSRRENSSKSKDLFEAIDTNIKRGRRKIMKERGEKVTTKKGKRTGKGKDEAATEYHENRTCVSDTEKPFEQSEKYTEADIDEELVIMQASENKIKTQNENNNRNREEHRRAEENSTRSEITEKVPEIKDIAKQNGEERRFESRDIFKVMARSISHALADKDENQIKRVC
ncbi:hypothetical protein NQ317_019418 [Molorchus minor]|uniref:TFIIS central domain-containing protein n=1 Tax=Molorchus minor TaxID=1323400 RepID=A0ABQ9JFG0_9CUCU|nr:hypothetical protein NQ317_019418 [Molorchus minor]